MKFFSVFHFHYVNLFDKKNSLIMMICLLIYCLSSFLIYGAESPTFEAVYFVFYAPRVPTLDLFRALLLVLSFLLIFTHFFQTEVRGRSSYILLRIKNMKLYFHSLFSVMILFTFVFVIIGYVIALLLTFIFSKVEITQTESLSYTINGSVLCQQYLLLALSITALLLINNVIVLLIKNIEIATVILVLIFIGSFYFVSMYPNQYLYIPFLYGFFDFQSNLADREYLLEVTILCFSSIVLYGISYLIYRGRKDFFS
ncbi:MAG: hypothetical protein RR651_05415 [Lysinibacillus sp.]